MTRAELRTICDDVGKDRLANMLEWSTRTIDRKLTGQHSITKSDEVAISAVLFAVRMFGPEEVEAKATKGPV